MLSTASSDTIAALLILPGGDVLLDPQSYDGEDVEDIVITGKKLPMTMAAPPAAPAAIPAAIPDIPAAAATAAGTLPVPGTEEKAQVLGNSDACGCE